MRILPEGGLRSPAVRRLILAVGAVACLLAAIGVFWNAAALKVTRGTVQGNRRNSAQVVYAAAEVDGKRIFSIDWSAAAAGVRSLDGILDARVRPQWPGGVRIAVVEAPLVLVWLDDTRIIAVDSIGTLEHGEGLTGLPHVRSSSGLPVDEAGRLRSDVLACALEYCGRFGDLTYDTEAGFSATILDGWTVHLGADPASVRLQMAVLHDVLGQLPADASAGALLDLRFPLRPYYRVPGEAS